MDEMLNHDISMSSLKCILLTPSFRKKRPPCTLARYPSKFDWGKLLRLRSMTDEVDMATRYAHLELLFLTDSAVCRKRRMSKLANVLFCNSKARWQQDGMALGPLNLHNFFIHFLWQLFVIRKKRKKKGERAEKKKFVRNTFMYGCRSATSAFS